MIMFSFFSAFLICVLGFLCTIVSVTLSNDVKIIGGFEANYGQFPYQVSLKMNGHHICGGTIINLRHVVTAGHCVVSTNNKLVSTGNLLVDVGTTSRSGISAVSRAIEKIYLHDNYSTNPIISNDIAVLRIKDTFTFNKFIQPIPVAQEVYTTMDNCTISGWGQTQLSDKKLPENLQYAVVQIIDIFACQSWIGNYLARDMLCAGYSVGGIDACQGDSGGPLVCNNTLTGVVSHGFGCALRGRPGIYTDVEVHKKWISDMLEASSSSVIIPLAPLIFILITHNLHNIFSSY